MEKLEVFELVIDTDDESGVTAIALVNEPAIESNWMAFTKQSEYKFAIKDEEKRIIEGYFMIADLLIPRLREDGTKFFVKFTSKTIEAIREKQSKLGLTNNFNLMHDPDKKADGVFMLDNIIIDNERGKVAPKEFEKVPNGSLWGSAKVDNEEIWQQVKDGTFKGFSVEGVFKQLDPVEVSEGTIEKIREAIQEFEKTSKQTLQLSKENTIENMSLEVIEKLKKILFNENEPKVEKFMSAELADGTMISIEPDLSEGAAVTIEIEGAVNPLPDGDYPLKDGNTITVSGGVILAIKEVQEEDTVQTQDADVPSTETVTEAKVRKIIESVETVFNEQIEKVKTELESVKTEFANYKEAVEVKEKAMFEAVEELAKEPSKEPTKKKKSGFMTAKPKSFAERLAEEKARKTNK